MEEREDGRRPRVKPEAAGKGEVAATLDAGSRGRGLTPLARIRYYLLYDHRVEWMDE